MINENFQVMFQVLFKVEVGVKIEERNKKKKKKKKKCLNRIQRKKSIVYGKKGFLTFLLMMAYFQLLLEPNLIKYSHSNVYYFEKKSLCFFEKKKKKIQRF